MRASTLSLPVVVSLFCSVTFAAPFTCEKVSSFGENRHDECQVTPVGGGPAKKLHVLKLKGKPADTSYAHGYLMAKDAESGVLGELYPKLKAVAAKFSAPEKLLFNCLVKKVHGSVSTEFAENLDAFFKGYLESPTHRGEAPMIAPHEGEILKAAALGIELENIVDGIKHRLDQRQVIENLSGVGDFIARLIRIPKLYKDIREGLKELRQECLAEIPWEKDTDVFEAIESLSKSLMPAGPRKYACTGFVSPEKTSKNGLFLHARNLDADLVRSWNGAPTLFLVQELDADGKARVPYVSPGTAGLFYTGSVGGMNRAGLTVSLHQMHSNKYKFAYEKPEADMAPYVSQRVLREARTLEDSVRIVRDESKHFAAWTLHVGDSKTNGVVSIELSPPITKVARASTNEAMPQTNHFVDPETFDSTFTPVYGKHLETRARFQLVEGQLRQKAGTIDPAFAVSMLSSHTDFYEGERSYGRTPAKVYGVMSTIMVPQLDARAKQEWLSQSHFWMTLGEPSSAGQIQSASHTTFVGFTVDWEKMEAVPFETRRNETLDLLPHWKKSTDTYIEARHKYIDGDKEGAIALLEQAIREAEQNAGDRHLPYHYALARILQETGNDAAAVKHWDLLWSKYASFGRRFPHAYQRALIALHSVISHRRLGTPLTDEKERLEFAGEFFRRDDHDDLLKKRQLVALMLKKKDFTPKKLPSLDMVSMD